MPRLAPDTSLGLGTVTGKWIAGGVIVGLLGKGAVARWGTDAERWLWNSGTDSVIGNCPGVVLIGEAGAEVASSWNCVERGLGRNDDSSSLGGVSRTRMAVNKNRYCFDQLFKHFFTTSPRAIFRND